MLLFVQEETGTGAVSFRTLIAKMSRRIEVQISNVMTQQVSLNVLLVAALDKTLLPVLCSVVGDKILECVER